MSNTTPDILGVVQGRATSALADALGNVIKNTYITNVTYDSSTHTLSFWCGSVLKYSCVIAQPMQDDITKPLYLLSKQNGSKIILSAVGTINDIYQYSYDGVTWTNHTPGYYINRNSGEGVYFRIKENRTDTFDNNNYITFNTSTGVIEAYNNVNSLLSPNFTNLTDLSSVVNSGARCFQYLFGSSSGSVSYLKRAPALPATTLSDSCYFYTFRNCTGLTKPPELPALNLARICYWYMFQDCTGLTQAPALPATTLANACYIGMFSGCTSLTHPPTLPATTTVTQCYSSMFKDCTGLTQAPDLPATNTDSMCYDGMFRGCTSLTKSPILPATTVSGTNCYRSMFYGCTSLSEVRIGATSISSTQACLSSWLYGVAETGDFYCDPNTSYSTGTSGIPTGWTRRDINDYPN